MPDRSKLDAYIAEMEAAAYERGKADARAEMKDTMQVLVKLAQDQLAEIIATTKSLLAQQQEGLVNREQTAEAAEPREPREGSDQGKVLGVIREHPGLRGVEVVKALDGKVEERTVRTALHRLKRRNAIMQREGTWHPVPMSLFKDESQPSV